MSMFERGETYVLQRKFRDGSTATNVDSAVMNIEYPCADGETNVNMVNLEVGLYQGAWDIPSDATYGEYLVTVTTVSGTVTTKFVHSFYVLPWNISQQVRSVSGIKESNDIDDDDIAIISWNAYLETKEHAFKRVIDEKLWFDGYHHIDGSNKTFFTRRRRVVSNHTICDENSIEGWYYDSNHDRQALTVSIVDADKGKISVADKDGDALSHHCCNPKITYRIKSSTYTEQMFKKAVVYLASHEIILRFNELDKATLGDLNSNRPIILANPDRMYKKYKQALKTIKKLKVGGI